MPSPINLLVQLAQSSIPIEIAHSDFPLQLGLLDYILNRDMITPDIVFD